MAALRELDRSLESAYRAHYPALFRRARRWLPPDEAEDLVQETFLRAWAHHGDADPGVPWLMTVLRNLAIDRSRRIHPDLTEDPGALQSPTSDDETGEKVVALEDRRRVREALGTLTTQQRAVITLREWAGLSQQEIADSLGTTIPSVESLLVRGRRRLRKALDHSMAAILWPTSDLWRKLKGMAAPHAAAGPGAVHGWTATMAGLATAATVLAAGAAAPLGGGHGSAPPPREPVADRIAPASAGFGLPPAERDTRATLGPHAPVSSSSGTGATDPAAGGETTGPIAEGVGGSEITSSDGDESVRPSTKEGPASPTAPQIGSSDDTQASSDSPHTNGDEGEQPSKKSPPVSTTGSFSADSSVSAPGASGT